MSVFLPKKYKVIALTVGGLRNKIFHSGETVTENDFFSNTADLLAEKGFLELINPLTEIRDTPEYNVSSNKKIKLCIGTMMWKRYELFKFWATQIRRLQKDFKNELEIIPVAVGSEGGLSRTLAERYNIHYLEHENLPLGRKANARLMFCKQFNPDYIMFLGSDDIICSGLMAEYIKEMRNNTEIIEVMDLYYYDLISKKAAYCEGYTTGRRKGEPLAVARCISKTVADVLGWKLWDNSRRISPDSCIYKALKTYDFTRTKLTIKDKYLVLDIKNDEGINTFKPEKDNWELIKRTTFKKFLHINDYNKLIRL